MDKNRIEGGAEQGERARSREALVIKYVEAYQHAYETVSDAREGIERTVNFHNTRGPHPRHPARTPDMVSFASLSQPSAGVA